MIKLEIPRTTFLVGFILGTLLEDNFRRAMQLSDGSYGIFLESALANMLWALVLVLVIWITVQQQRSEGHTSEFQSLMRISYAVFGWKNTQPIQHVSGRLAHLR